MNISWLILHSYSVSASSYNVCFPKDFMPKMRRRQPWNSLYQDQCCTTDWTGVSRPLQEWDGALRLNQSPSQTLQLDFTGQKNYRAIYDMFHICWYFTQIMGKFGKLKMCFLFMIDDNVESEISNKYQVTKYQSLYYRPAEKWWLFALTFWDGWSGGETKGWSPDLATYWIRM